MIQHINKHAIYGTYNGQEDEPKSQITGVAVVF